MSHKLRHKLYCYRRNWRDLYLDWIQVTAEFMLVLWLVVGAVGYWLLWT